MNSLVDIVDAVEVRPRDVDSGNVAGDDRGGDLVRGQVREVGPYDSSSRRRGTRNRPSSAAGAAASTSSRSSDGTIASSRNTLVSGSACDVGGMSSAATSPTRATAARITS